MKLSARKLKNISVYVGDGRLSSDAHLGSVIVGSAFKLIAELLRIAFYRETRAPDMARLSYFFIGASLLL